MVNRIEVTRTNLNHIDFNSVIVLTFAAEGAMGEAGGVELFTAGGVWYHLNYVHGSVSLELLCRAFPSCPTNLAQMPECWHDFYLGAGNCLYLHERVYQKYLEDHDSDDPEDIMLWWRSVQEKRLFTKQERYTRLVAEAKSSYPQAPTGQTDELVWCGACQDEINLWTYWQGRGCLDPEILVVGQDWGNPNTKAGQQCLENIEKQLPYLENNSSPSDQNLAVLFAKGLGIDISKRDERLFFTNLVLGYRTGRITGALSAAQYAHDLPYFKTLINILQPKVVICLGQDTFTYALRAFGEKSFFPKGYIAALNDQENCFDIDGIRFYGMSHCGTYGCKNRGGNVAAGLALQIEDWRHIR